MCTVLSGYPDEEVDHEEDVECEIDLLCGAVGPLLTRLYRLTVTSNTQTNLLLQLRPGVITQWRSHTRCVRTPCKQNA